MRRITVIMAGGGGTRFWPLSRQEKPKQLIRLTSNNVMINDTIDHFKHIVPREDTYIVTNTTQFNLMNDIVYPEVNRANILQEPFGRNTAPCILYAAMVLKKQYGDALMAVLPADHHISDIPEYERILDLAYKTAEMNSNIVTIGLWPTFESTGYGYIRFSEKPVASVAEEIHHVERFVEKPVKIRAEEYFRSGRYLWNSGMFIWKVSVILEYFEKFLPDMYQTMNRIYDKLRTTEEQNAINEVYSDLQSISIDYGIMEKASNIYVIPAEFGWSDVGSWDALSAIYPLDDSNNVIRANHIGIDTENCVINSINGKLIATLGVKDLIIVDTGDAIMICQRDRAQDVKKLVDILHNQNKTEYL